MMMGEGLGMGCVCGWVGSLLPSACCWVRASNLLFVLMWVWFG
jgi:hypothetical protein